MLNRVRKLSIQGPWTLKPKLSSSSRTLGFCRSMIQKTNECIVSQLLMESDLHDNGIISPGGSSPSGGTLWPAKKVGHHSKINSHFISLSKKPNQDLGLFVDLSFQRLFASFERLVLLSPYKYLFIKLVNTYTLYGLVSLVTMSSMMTSSPRYSCGSVKFV
jgi:hypothetical protein